MFLPTTRKEMKALGWEELDAVIVTGDAYIDSPYIGAAVIGHVLADAGFRVGIIAQPDIHSPDDITRLDEPRLFWGVSAGSVDSMVANYTPVGKPRRMDDLTAGGENNRRPDRATIVYSNLIRQYFKSTVPIVLGGIEASLRRIPHYDAWNNKIRRPVLFDAKADLLVYGMGEKAVLEIARRRQKNQSLSGIPGTCEIGEGKPDGYIILPSFEVVSADPGKFNDMFVEFYEHNHPGAPGMVQLYADRFLIHHPPQSPPTPQELDRIYESDYEQDVHPSEIKRGEVRALDTIRFSLTTHRGCFGECSFCAIAVHQGRNVVSRSEESLLREARRFTRHPHFKGVIQDVGGPTANMYGMDCARNCRNKTCLLPVVCPSLPPNHSRQINLLRRLREIPGVKRVSVQSGIRHDLILADRQNGETYLKELLTYHISGQMKIAPEHVDPEVLRLMGKPSMKSLTDFLTLFKRVSHTLKRPIFLTYYFIAAHPGSGIREIMSLKQFIRQTLKTLPEQTQIFTPTPSTFSTLMYYTAKNPSTGEPVFVEKTVAGKQKQKDIILASAEELQGENFSKKRK